MNGAACGSMSKTQLPLLRAPNLYMICDTPKGRGVFASELIPAATIIETCPVLVLDPAENREHIAKTSLYHYTYNWPLPESEGGGGAASSVHGRRTAQTQAVVLGLGSLFNHSSRRQNVGWTRDLTRQVVVYRALRDIPAHEELCISYGDRLTFVDADGALSESSDEETEEMFLKIET